jgi:pimeloyl-ACP methyl ester carboxylesterase
MPYVRANGLDIHYTVEGEGPPMVMLHGATSSGLDEWSAQRPLFRKAFTLYLPDARGHGGTKWDAADGFDKELLVADLKGFVDELGLETFHLVGFSMGAMTSLTFATRYPERLRTALIAGIDVQREPRARVAKRMMDPERIDREEADWAERLRHRHDPVQGHDAWRRLLPAIAADVATQAQLTPGELRRARLPILLAYGDRDVFVPADHAVALQRQLPDARLLIAPDCGHQVQIQRPALFNDAANVFYRTTERVARERASAGVTRQLAARLGGGGPAVTSAPGAGAAIETAAKPGPAAMVLDPTAPTSDEAPTRSRDAEREQEWFELW